MEARNPLPVGTEDVEGPLARSAGSLAVSPHAERALIVGLVSGDGTVAEAEESLQELALLTDTAGAAVVAAVLAVRMRDVGFTAPSVPIYSYGVMLGLSPSLSAVVD